MSKDIEKLYAAIESIKTGMMVTRRRDGHLRARAMATQKHAAGADLWFVAREGSAKLADLEHDRHVNLAFYRDGNREWISVSGIADISRDRDKIRELHQPDWSIWFADEGGEHDGTPDDPRMVLIGVTVHAAEFFEVDKPKPVLLLEMVKGWVTGQEPEFGTMHHLDQPHR